MQIGITGVNGEWIRPDDWPKIKREPTTTSSPQDTTTRIATSIITLEVLASMKNRVSAFNLTEYHRFACEFHRPARDLQRPGLPE